MMSDRKEIEISNDEQIRNFVKTHPDYYIREFNKIGIVQNMFHLLIRMLFI
jgi:hypothetical protein